MANTDHVVDPALDSNTGSGSLGDPYGDLQFALNSIARNTADGDVVHVKMGAEEAMTGPLDLTLYGTPAPGAPLTIRGFANDLNDGGIGEINCGGFEFADNNHIHFKDLKFRNGSAGNTLVARESTVDNVWIDDGVTGLLIGARTQVTRLFVSNCSLYGANTTQSTSSCSFSFFRNGTKKFTIALRSSGAQFRSLFNSALLDDASDALVITSGDGNFVMGNSFLKTSAATGTGITFPNTKYGHLIFNNLVEGFGTNYDFGNNSEPLGMVGNNSSLTSGTDYTTLTIPNLLDPNEVLSVSPFAKSGTINNDDFVNNNAAFWESVKDFFFPVDTGGVYSPHAGTLLPVRGAVQTVGGGGGTTNIGYSRSRVRR